MEPSRRILRSTSTWPILLAMAILFASCLSGCRVIYPPAEDAVQESLDAITCADRSTLEKLIEDTALLQDMRTLCVAFGGDVYRGMKDYWTIEEVEVDEAEEMTYVYVTIEVPGAKRSKFIEVVFYMQRDFLDWKILDVEGVGVALKAIEKARAGLY